MQYIRVLLWAAFFAATTSVRAQDKNSTISLYFDSIFTLKLSDVVAANVAQNSVFTLLRTTTPSSSTPTSDIAFNPTRFTFDQISNGSVSISYQSSSQPNSSTVLTYNSLFTQTNGNTSAGTLTFIITVSQRERATNVIAGKKSDVIITISGKNNLAASIRLETLSSTNYSYTYTDNSSIFAPDGYSTVSIFTIDATIENTHTLTLKLSKSFTCPTCSWLSLVYDTSSPIFYSWSVLNSTYNADVDQTVQTVVKIPVKSSRDPATYGVFQPRGSTVVNNRSSHKTASPYVVGILILAVLAWLQF